MAAIGRRLVKLRFGSGEKTPCPGEMKARCNCGRDALANQSAHCKPHIPHSGHAGCKLTC